LSFAGGILAGRALLQREPGCTVSGNHLLAAIHRVSGFVLANPDSTRRK